MRIGIVRYWGRTKIFNDLRGLLGVDSIANICDGSALYNHVDGMARTFDAVLFIATPDAMKWYVENKPTRWGKVFFVYYTWPPLLNNSKEIESVGLFDGILTFFNNKLSWEIFGKPVIEMLLPCVPESYPAEKCEKVCVIVKTLQNSYVNFLDTLSVFKKTGMRGIVSTNSAVPYCNDTDGLRALVNHLNIELEVSRPKNRQEYMAEIADCSVMLSMDARQSYGRWVIDAAQLGIPCVGTYSTMQDILMRDYLVHSNELDRAAELVTTAKPVSVDWCLFDPIRLRKHLEHQIETAFRN